MSIEEVVAVEQESSGGIDPLIWVLVAVGVVLVAAAIGLAIWLTKRNAAPARAQGFGGQFGGPMPQSPMPQNPMPQSPMAPGWYPDPQRRARLRWFDGNQWTPAVQN